MFWNRKNTLPPQKKTTKHHLRLLESFHSSENTDSFGKLTACCLKKLSFDPKTYRSIDSLLKKKKKVMRNWMSIHRTLKLGPYSSHCTKFNSNWIKALEVRPETMGLLETTWGNNLQYLYKPQYPDRTPVTQEIIVLPNWIVWY